MSGKVVGWAMDQVTGSPAAKLVLVKLADNATEEGLAWPSVALVTEHTELGQSTVYRHLTALEGAGLIKPTLVCVNPGNSNEYSCPGWQLNVPPEWRIPRAGKRAAAAGKPVPPVRKAIPAAGMPYKEEPSQEPSLNQAPSVASALQPRVTRLRERIGDGYFQHWFGDAEFIDDLPIKIIVPKESIRNRIKERYLGYLWDLFGDDVLVLLSEAADA